MQYTAAAAAAVFVVAAVAVAVAAVVDAAVTAAVVVATAAVVAAAVDAPGTGGCLRGAADRSALRAQRRTAGAPAAPGSGTHRDLPAKQKMK